jgi:AraC-like DNA-binding protein
MNTLHSSLYAVAFAACVLSCLVVLRSASTRGRSRYLVALLALQAVNFGVEWLMANPSTPAKALWLTGVMSLAFLSGPLIWLHARSIDEPTMPRLSSLPPLHLLPIVVGVLLLVPLLATTHAGSGFARPDPPHSGVFPAFIHETMIASVALFAMQAFHYLRASLRILRRNAGVAKAILSDLEDRDLDALRLMIIVVGAHWLVGIARTLQPLLLGKDAGYVVLFALCEVAFMLWAVVRLLGAANRVQPADRQLAHDLPEDPKYAKSALDAPTRARIARKLGEAWAEGMHRDSRLTLRLLCERLRESPHYVSQVINQDLAGSFYDLVNRQRIADAMNGLAREPHRPVIEIALEVGFNSKSTFNAAFRAIAGNTPTEFRKAVLAPSPAAPGQVR